MDGIFRGPVGSRIGLHAVITAARKKTQLRPPLSLTHPPPFPSSAPATSVFPGFGYGSAKPSSSSVRKVVVILKGRKTWPLILGLRLAISETSGSADALLE